MIYVHFEDGKIEEITSINRFLDMGSYEVVDAWMKGNDEHYDIRRIEQ